MMRLWDFKLRFKMILLTVLVAGGAALVFAIPAIFYYEKQIWHPAVVAELEAQAAVLEATLATALTFGFPVNAAEDLAKLESRPDILAARLFDRRGQVFADYLRPGLEAFPFPDEPPEVGARWRAGALDLTLHVRSSEEDGNEFFGHLYLHRGEPSLVVRLQNYFLVLAGTFFALLAASLLLTTALGRFVTDPILELATAAQRVRDEEDYSVRVEKRGDDEIGRLTDAFNQMLATIEQRDAALRQAYDEQKELQEKLVQAQKMESIGRLAGGVAHDFNNYLTVIVGALDLTMRGLPESSPLRPLLENAQLATGQASNLTRQLLAFARKQIIEPKLINPNRLVLDFEKMLSSVIGDDVELSVVPNENIWPIRADPNQMTQVLLNMATNARDAMPDGGNLCIEIDNVVLDEDFVSEHLEFEPGEYVLLSISDTGQGVDEDARQHLFEPFFTTKERGKGTGLGLATCYGIVRQSGGQILVHSAPGQGTVFEIYLERALGEAEEPEESGKITPLPAGEETVLIVEDNDLVRMTAVELLEIHGYTVLEAASGAEALRLVEEHDGKIDLLLSDVVMPQMSGKVMADEIRRLHPYMKVLFVSGYAADDIARHGVLEAGIEFLQKPYTSEILMRRVRKMLDMAAARAAAGSSSSVGNS